MFTRRKFLQTSTAATFSAAVLASFPPSIRRALAIQASTRTGTIMDVQHVVILMQENRSFDHYFGTMRGVRGFGDRFAIPLPGQRKVWQQRRGGNASLLSSWFSPSLAPSQDLITPFHLDGKTHRAQRAAGVPHAWADSQEAWGHGRLSNWAVAKTNASMGYMKEPEIPFHFALANAFTLCDAYHCSMHAGTDPNRAFFLTGTNGAIPQGRAFVKNEWDAIHGTDADANKGYTWKTYAERLEEAGISWISYQNMPDEWGDNMLGAFQNFRRANLASGFPVSSGDSPTKPYNKTGQALPYHAYDAATDNAANPLYKGIANTLPGSKPGEYLATFRRDIHEGKLPQVSWVNAPSIYCEHPGPSSPVQGAWFLQEILDALTANPEVWSKTVLLINYDENDGYFDHMPSPSAPSRNPDNSYAGKTTLAEADLQAEYFTHEAPEGSVQQPKPDGLVYGPGPRVPMFVVSPWSRGGWVNSQVFDHTSVLRFLEARFGVHEPNISPFRRAVCGDLTSTLNFKTPNNETVPPLIAERITRSQADKLRFKHETMPLARPPKDAPLPQQDPGTRPSRALPYELHTSARCRVSGEIELLFANSGTQAAVFHVYDQFQLERIPRRYMVEADKTLSDVWQAGSDNEGKYDLWVLGPNGFHRHFKGDLKRLEASLSAPEIRVCYDIKDGKVSVDLLNTGQQACQFKIVPEAYRQDGPWTITVMANATATQEWELHDSGQWYDFSVSCDSDPLYYRRFAGRVETGQHGISDPAMGADQAATESPSS